MTEPTSRVLGLDPGSRVLGYAVVDLLGRGRFVYRECGAITTRASAPITERLLEIATELREVIREYHPTVVAMEDVFHSRNARSALVLGQARGAALLIAAEHGLEVSSYPPATVKRTVCGNGRAAKEQVQQMVAALARLKRPPAVDAADALAVAICHCLQAGAGSRAALARARGGPVKGAPK
ncbi:MAG: crossover junction endodeoxyribonuclease RuvC [bacterium]